MGRNWQYLRFSGLASMMIMTICFNEATRLLESNRLAISCMPFAHTSFIWSWDNQLWIFILILDKYCMQKGFCKTRIMWSLDKCCMLLADASSVGLPSVNLPSTCHTCLSTYNILLWGEIQNKLWNTNKNTKTNSGIQIDITNWLWNTNRIDHL